MTRDANKQSVECNDYSHLWTEQPEPEGSVGITIKCDKCGAFPKRKMYERAEGIASLRKLLKPGDTVYTTLRHVSRSGMQRVIDLHIIQDSEPRWIGYTAAKAMGDRYDDKKSGIVAGGCGMDMGFALVYNLGRTLFPDGFGEQGKLPLGHEIRPRTKEEAAKAVAKGARFCGRNGDPSGWDNDGGYALKQRWL